MAKKIITFGEHLVNKGYLTSKDKFTAKYFLKETNKQVGQLMIKQNHLTALKIREIAAQNSKKKTAADIEINLKKLDRNQVKEILKLQKKFHVQFGTLFQYDITLSQGNIEKEFKDYLRTTEPEIDPDNDDKAALAEAEEIKKLISDKPDPEKPKRPRGRPKKNESTKTYSKPRSKTGTRRGISNQSNRTQKSNSTKNRTPRGRQS